MAYRRRKPKITMGKVFRTRKGRLGCYKYVNGRKVAFIPKKKYSKKKKTYRRRY